MAANIEFIALTSSTQVAGATTRLTLTIGNKLRNPTMPFMKMIMDRFDEWKKIELRMNQFPNGGTPPKNFEVGCFPTDGPFDHLQAEASECENESKRQNNRRLFGSDLFAIERQYTRDEYYDSYDFPIPSATWHTSGKLIIEGRHLEKCEKFSFFINNPLEARESVDMTLLINDIPIRRYSSNVFDVKKQETVKCLMLSPLWVSTPPMKIVVPCTKRDFDEATGVFNFDDINGTSLASKVLRFNISVNALSDKPSAVKLFFLATNILVELFDMPVRVKEYMKSQANRDEAFAVKGLFEQMKEKGAGPERLFWFLHYVMGRDNILSKAISQKYGLEESDPRKNLFSQLGFWGNITEEWQRQGIFEGTPFLPLPGGSLAMDPFSTLMNHHKFMTSMSLYGNHLKEDPYYPGNYEDLLEMLEYQFPIQYDTVEHRNLVEMMRMLLAYLQENLQNKKRGIDEISVGIYGYCF